ncbi:uncharacterized protein UV8b_02759 [Ustilaginoidea virens]|uniref:Rieske domain-containing protein n=1 Tax=Ustilaginoidea virens TaxID=1159556 RepID=A0A1B5L5S6_USTVR|nr:uncharacterized protein UV8b_02759 [Ustilaginoidea virens]QUC18518.1 hypothetical protein UV8b_02759 [Ustilaginoidea virens]GAO18912.1 hypothetical protein UVI_02030810 [Ustilaginoidea virens]
MNLFRSRPDTSWVPVGPASSFPDLGEDTGSLLESRLCDAKLQPGCKIFRVPKDDPSKSEQVFLSSDDPEAPGRGDDLLDQVLIFRYRGRFHAVDHRCPHSAYPLSNGMPFDIEDFGVRLSAGLTCPKHGWAFDLFTGMADTGRYKLAVWELQLRDGSGTKVIDPLADESDHVNRTLWVRRKQRMG